MTRRDHRFELMVPKIDPTAYTELAAAIAKLVPADTTAH